MSELTFQVLGPNKRPLNVVFKKNGKNLTATCSCTTDAHALCQHTINILSGSSKEVISKNADDVKKVTSWIAGTDVGKALHDMLEAAKLLENATEDLQSARKRLVKALKD